MKNDGNHRGILGAWMLVAGIVGAAFMIRSGFSLGNMMRIDDQSIDSMRPSDISRAWFKEASRDVAISMDDDAVLGDPASPVSLIVVGDFTCLLCKRFAVDVLPKLQTTYIDTHRVSMVFRDSVRSDIGDTMAEAAECAGNEGKYWNFFFYLMQLPDNIVSKTDNIIETFIAKAASEGMDVVAFEDCVRGRAHHEEVIKDTEDARRAGISIAPTFVINGKIIPGISTFEDFQGIIEEELTSLKKE